MTSNRAPKDGLRPGALLAGGLVLVVLGLVTVLTVVARTSSTAVEAGTTSAAPQPTMAEIGQAPTTTVAPPTTSAAATVEPSTTSIVSSGSSASSTAAPTTTFAPAPPGCRVVTFTPPTASAPMAGELCVPSRPAHGVTIVLVHGGGGSTGKRSDLDAWRDEYNQRGYETLAIDYTIIGSRGTQTIFPLPEQNTKAAIQWLRKNEGPRAAKVILHGASAGARLGGIVLTTPGHPKFAGRELWPDVSDAIDGLIGFYGYYNGAQYQYAGYFSPGDELDPSISSTSRARFASGPVLMFHGAIDTFIPPSESQRFADRLKSAGKSVELVIVPDMNHGYDGYGYPKLSDLGHQNADKAEQWLTQFNQS